MQTLNCRAVYSCATCPLPDSALRNNVTRGGDDDPWFTKLGNQSLGKPFRCFGIPAGLHKKIMSFLACIYRAPQPEFLAPNRDDNFVRILLVVWPWTIPADAICEMLAKPIDPKPDHFGADNHAPFCQQVFDISRAQCEALVNPNCVNNNLTRIAEAP